MTALERFHEAANDALETIAARLPADAKICLAVYTPGKPESDIVLKDPSASLDEVVSTLRRRGLSIDGDNLYKQDLCDCIVGAIAVGFQGTHRPPEGHWGQRFWDLGRDEGARSDKLLLLVRQMRAYMDEAGIDSKPESTNPLEKLASRIDVALAEL